MLQSLAALDPARAEAILCRTIDAVLPRTEIVELDEVEQKVLDEARSVAAAHPHKSVEEVLGDALTDFGLPPSEEEAARIRLGKSGQLPWELFDVEFSKVGWKNLMCYGVTSGEAREALRKPDLVEHLHSGAPQTDERLPSVALTFTATRVSGAGVGGRAHWLLLLIGRYDATLSIRLAFRVFDDLVRANRIERPRDLMRALLMRCGREFTLTADSGKHLLFWDERMEHEAPVPNIAGMVVVILSVGNLKTAGSRRVVAFCLNERSYKQYMELHGIRY